MDTCEKYLDERGSVNSKTRKARPRTEYTPKKETHHVEVRNGTESYHQEVEMIRCDEQYAIFEAGKGDIHRIYLLKKAGKVNRSTPIEGDVFFVYGKIDYHVKADGAQSAKAEKLLTRLKESPTWQSVTNKILKIQLP